MKMKKYIKNLIRLINYERDAEKINKIESLGMKIVEPGLWRIEVPKSSLTNYHIKRIDLLNK